MERDAVLSRFWVVFQPLAGGSVRAFLPSVPTLWAVGPDGEAARRFAVAALPSHLERLARDGEVLPPSDDTETLAQQPGAACVEVEVDRDRLAALSYEAFRAQVWNCIVYGR